MRDWRRVTGRAAPQALWPVLRRGTGACSSAPTPTTRWCSRACDADEVDGARSRSTAPVRLPAALRTPTGRTCSTCSSRTAWSSTPPTRLPLPPPVRALLAHEAQALLRDRLPPRHGYAALAGAARGAPPRRRAGRAARAVADAAAPRRGGLGAPGRRGRPTTGSRPTGRAGLARCPPLVVLAGSGAVDPAAAASRGEPAAYPSCRSCCTAGGRRRPGRRARRALPALPRPGPRRPRPGVAGPARPAGAGRGSGPGPRSAARPRWSALAAVDGRHGGAGGARRAGAPGGSLAGGLAALAGGPAAPVGGPSAVRLRRPIRHRLGDPPTRRPAHRREWPGERAPPPRRQPHGPSGQPAPRLRRAHRRGVRQAGRRQAGRGRSRPSCRPARPSSCSRCSASSRAGR